MPALGPDYRLAQSHWLYDAKNNQPLVFVVIATIVLVAMQLGLPILGQLVFGFLNAEEIAAAGGALTPNLMARASVFTFAVLIPASLLVTWLVTRVANMKGGDWRSASAWRWPRLGWGGWTLALLAFVVGVGLTASVMRYLSGDVTSQGLVEQMVRQLRDMPIAKIVFPLAIVIAGPVAEEFLFRGPLFARLVDTSLGRWGTVVVTSFVWALVHVTQPWIAIAQIFVMGLGLGALLLRFGSIWVCVVAHSVWNLITTIVLFTADFPPIP